MCLNPQKVCDGFADCPHFDDELLCRGTCPNDCECDAFTMKCGIQETQNLTFPLYVRKLDLSNSDLRSPKILLADNMLLAEMNLSSSMFSDLNKLIFGNDHNLFSLDLSFNNIEVIPMYAFRGLKHLKKLLIHGNVLLHTIYPHAFEGLTRLPSLVIRHAQLQIVTKDTLIGLDNLETLNMTESNIKRIDDFAFTGLHKLKSLDIHQNSITEFSAGIFQGLESLEKIVSDMFVFCCLKPLSVKEENCFPLRDEFSFCTDMMKTDSLRICLWVIGLSGLIGNVAVVFYRIIYDRASLSKGHGIFITSLGTADFLMGIYLIIIASADAMFRGTYVWNDISRRYGTLCKLAGVLSTVSSECSVLFLFFITIDRFIIIKYPFGQIRFSKTLAQATSCVVFMIGILLATIPLMPGASYFDGTFYSRSAVCLTLPLTRDRPSGWEFSFGIFIIFNFLLFIIFAGFQMAIFREITSILGQIKSNRKRQDMTVARNLFLVVFSDFLCWCPVGVMGLYIFYVAI